MEISRDRSKSPLKFKIFEQNLKAIRKRLGQKFRILKIQGALSVFPTKFLIGLSSLSLEISVKQSAFFQAFCDVIRHFDHSRSVPFCDWTGMMSVL